MSVLPVHRRKSQVVHSIFRLAAETQTISEVWECNESVRQAVQSGGTVLCMLSAVRWSGLAIWQALLGLPAFCRLSPHGQQGLVCSCLQQFIGTLCPQLNVTVRQAEQMTAHLKFI